VADFTAPEEFLREISDINLFILDLIASPRRTTWHWPSYYLLYVDADRMGWLIQQAGNLVGSPLEGVGNPHRVEQRVEGTNEFFDTLRKRQESIVQWLWPLARHTNLQVEHSASRERLHAHVHPKSDWYETFMRDFCPGRVSLDGLVLERTVLLTDPATECDRFSHVDGRGLLQRQSFDLSTGQARLALSRAVCNAGIEHGKVCRAMKDFFIEHCAITDLVHPASV
jgi:hypothetical protein